ncbi:hypothetical protein VPH35_129367 [Triticum aestivum]
MPRLVYDSRSVRPLSSSLLPSWSTQPLRHLRPPVLPSPLQPQLTRKPREEQLNQASPAGEGGEARMPAREADRLASASASTLLLMAACVRKRGQATTSRCHRRTHGARSPVRWARPPRRRFKMPCPTARNARAWHIGGMPQSKLAATCTARPQSSPTST